MYAAFAKIVGKLTACGYRRHEFDGRRLILSGTVLLSMCATEAVAAEALWQSPESIAAAAESLVRERMGRDADRTSVRAGRLDPRHRLEQCSQPLEPFLRSGTEIGYRTVVGVRCRGAKAWKVYLPVQVIVTDTVYVARRTLPRGHLLTVDDLVAEPRDVSRLLSGYVRRPDEFRGTRLKAQLLAGRPLTPAMLAADIVVRRGQTVTLTVADGGINIQMSGKALMDGAVEQRIRVENLNSGRIVEGIVRSREHVEVLVARGGQFFHAKPKVSPSVADIRSSNNDR